MSYHLAWHTKHIPSAMMLGREVNYLLIPADAPTDQSLLVQVSVITDSGRPIGSTDAFWSQLSCLRDPATPEGTVDPDEGALIAALLKWASKKGHSVPLIIPTTRKPHWSCAAISRMTRVVLIRSAGVI